MSVQSRSLFPYQKHLVNKALKFSIKFFSNNGDMSSPKRHVFISLLFILKYCIGFSFCHGLLQEDFSMTSFTEYYARIAEIYIFNLNESYKSFIP